MARNHFFKEFGPHEETTYKGYKKYSVKVMKVQHVTCEIDDLDSDMVLQILLRRNVAYHQLEYIIVAITTRVSVFFGFGFYKH
jgi:hypothetical protein